MKTGRKKIMQKVKSRIVAIFMATGILVAMPMLLDVYHARAEREDYPTLEGLRGVFISQQKTGKGLKKVGRLGFYLIQRGSAVQVRHDHPFKNGDQFRLGIASKHNGWYYYVIHRQKGQQPALVWPRMKSGRHLDDNGIEASRTVMVPPEPLAFNFDAHTGMEYFYVVISQERKVPDLSITEGYSSETTSENYIDSIANFTFRGDHESDSGCIRSEVLYPSANNPDMHVYFSSPEKKDEKLIIMGFRLRHE